MNYVAVFYYEENGRIHVRFPSLIKAGFPASTGGNNKREALAAAKDVLAIVRDISEQDKKPLPNELKLEEVNVNRGFEDLAELLRIEIEYVVL
ncbi:type II toxin-antitoxin system HicB family antitoxin [Priestia megaterium]|uniref:type II toxin-antitoxin system HicB family antitoxin n=1 Tax=Priestia megaterium TaxID=1404 RepID=UPI00196BAF4B|nr:hypothetical protein [Priestia megaterium]QSF36963.1 hypothetical protein ICR96_16000 [Priestia megaterium]